MNMKLLLENWRRFTEKNSSLEEANLSTGELKKVRGGKLRLEKFIEKISKGLPFSTTDGREVIIHTDILNQLEQLKISKDFSEENLVKIFGSKVITLPLTDGSTIKLTSLKKTKDLGGEEPGKRLAAEDLAIGELQKFISDAMQQSSSDSIDIIISDKSGNAVLKIDKVVGTKKQEKVGGIDPKADFLLVREDGRPTIYISHKDQKFGQWGGITVKAGAGIENNPEVVAFANAIKNNPNFVDTKNVNGKTVYTIKPKIGTIGSHIKNQSLKLLGVFGNESLDKEGNLDKKSAGNAQRVDIIAHGAFDLKQVPELPNTYELSCGHIITRKGFSGVFEEEYEPILVARYMEDRSNHGINRVRMAIYPKAGRKITHWIDGE